MSDPTKEQIKAVSETVESVAKLSDATKDTDFDWDKYIKKPIPRLDLVWFLIPAALLLAVILTLVFSGFTKIIFILGVGIVGWLVFVVQQRWDNWIGTIIAFITASTLLLLAGNLITPEETSDQVKEFVKEKTK